MSRISALSKDAVPELAEGFAKVEAILGFVPNSNLIMARHPALLRGFQQLAVAALAPGKVPAPVKIMVAHMASHASGCNYCIAHTGHITEKNGIPAEKFAAIWDYETSALYSPAERAAIAVARGAAQVPNSVTDSDFDELKRHWSEDQCVEIVGVIALYGFLNRFNDTVATDLENHPLEFARANLAGKGWELGKHGGDQSRDDGR
ncbi:MAG: carboxymuconolactone decarboxylase family protein [Beijerinckiaceae bacterium]